MCSGIGDKIKNMTTCSSLGCVEAIAIVGTGADINVTFRADVLSQDAPEVHAVCIALLGHTLFVSRFLATPD